MDRRGAREGTGVRCGLGPGHASSDFSFPPSGLWSLLALTTIEVEGHSWRLLPDHGLGVTGTDSWHWLCLLITYCMLTLNGGGTRNCDHAPPSRLCSAPTEHTTQMHPGMGGLPCSLQAQWLFRRDIRSWAGHTITSGKVSLDSKA